MCESCATNYTPQTLSVAAEFREANIWMNMQWFPWQARRRAKILCLKGFYILYITGIHSSKKLLHVAGL